ncbi:MAG TPA: glycosyltransferase family 2 protein [Pyrinomonadaceae bacterium]|nr:glycosyltransferase family 2 protein [Pyrinomonadaceae bacterium]
MSILNKPGISVFFPAFNDAGSIGGLVDVALEILPALTDDYEVIVVNDGSTDATADVLDLIARKHPQVRIVHHERNLGYGAALQTGFRSARKELVFYTDGDGQYDVRELSTLRRLLTDDVDVVNGYKIKRSDGASRKLLGGIYNQTARLMFQLPIRDVDCDFRLMRRQRVQEVEITSSTGAVCVELISKLHRSGCTFAEAPVGHYPRLYGNSQFFTYRRVLNTAIDFSRLWWRTFGAGTNRVRNQLRQTDS